MSWASRRALTPTSKTGRALKDQGLPEDRRGHPGGGGGRMWQVEVRSAGGWVSSGIGAVRGAVCGGLVEAVIHNRLDSHRI